MRLIDADALERRFHLYGLGEHRLIKDAPTIDAVEVVRCGNCEHWNRDNISCEGLAKCVTGETGIRYRAKNDFCSKAKKRN